MGCGIRVRRQHRFPALAAPPSTDAKSIPKPILMLALYCHSAIEEMRLAYTRGHSNVEISKDQIVASFLGVFDKNRIELGGMCAKAVNDAAITPNEGKFLDLTARKDAILWVKFSGEKCAGTLFDGAAPKDEQCLRNINSEVFKCYQLVNEQAGALRAKNQAAPAAPQP
jgi:hypothetical protein